MVIVIKACLHDLKEFRFPCPGQNSFFLLPSREPWSSFDVEVDVDSFLFSFLSQAFCFSFNIPTVFASKDNLILFPKRLPPMSSMAFSHHIMVAWHGPIYSYFSFFGLDDRVSIM